MIRPDVLIVGGARTPMTDYAGALKDVSAIELGAMAARGAFEPTGVRPEWIDHARIEHQEFGIRAPIRHDPELRYPNS
jgi:acetyl-CoA acetyltransferase